jgi:hypothetical protein
VGQIERSLKVIPHARPGWHVLNRTIGGDTFEQQPAVLWEVPTEPLKSPASHASGGDQSSLQALLRVGKMLYLMHARQIQVIPAVGTPGNGTDQGFV